MYIYRVGVRTVVFKHSRQFWLWNTSLWDFKNQNNDLELVCLLNGKAMARLKYRFDLFSVASATEKEFLHILELVSQALKNSSGPTCMLQISRSLQLVLYLVN